jgi:molybdopterin synthase sulfur carrier subunit
VLEIFKVEILSGKRRNLRSGILAGCPQSDSFRCLMLQPASASADGNFQARLLARLPNAGYNSFVAAVSQTVRVKVLFFGRLKELARRSEDAMEISEASTIEQLFALCAARNPELAKFRTSLVVSRNLEFAAWDTPLRSGDEVAFLPPVSGG